MDSFQFTRYLYEKDEVKLSLLFSLLNKSDEAVFWAYELFYSGFKDELIEWVWIIYYDFYYSKNPSFEKYLSSKLNNNSTTNNIEDKLIASIINNLMIRPFSIDVFILRKILSLNVETNTEFNVFKSNLKIALINENYLEIASLILNKMDEEKYVKILELVIEFFVQEQKLKIDIKRDIKEYKKIVKLNNIKIHNKKIVLLSRIIHYFGVLKNVKLGKKLYVHIEEEDIVMYDPIDAILDNNKFLPYKILPNACVYNIDSKNYLSLFHLKRDNYNIELSYRDNWLYYASYSPLWKKRILKYNGVIDNKERKITFLNEDDAEMFYNEFGYEPDEQKIEVQQKIIKPIKKERSWLSFYDEFKNNRLIDIKESHLTQIEKCFI